MTDEEQVERYWGWLGEQGDLLQETEAYRDATPEEQKSMGKPHVMCGQMDIDGMQYRVYHNLVEDTFELWCVCDDGSPPSFCAHLPMFTMMETIVRTAHVMMRSGLTPDAALGSLLNTGPIPEA